MSSPAWGFTGCSDRQGRTQLKDGCTKCFLAESTCYQALLVVLLWQHWKGLCMLPTSLSLLPCHLPWMQPCTLWCSQGRSVKRSTAIPIAQPCGPHCSMAWHMPSSSVTSLSASSLFFLLGYLFLSILAAVCLKSESQHWHQWCFAVTVLIFPNYGVLAAIRWIKEVPSGSKEEMANSLHDKHSTSCHWLEDCTSKLLNSLLNSLLASLFC